MYRASTFSALLHVAVLLFAYFGLPHFAPPPLMVDYPVPVEVVTIAEKTNAPPPKPAEVKPEPPKPEPPKPKPVKAPPPPPPPKPEAVAPPPPEPEPAPKPEPPKAVVEAPAPLPKPKQKPEPAEKPVKPERKSPPPPDQFASVLKTIEKLKTTAAAPQAKTAETSSRPAPPNFDAAAPITISQIDAIRRHFEKCWNIPAGAREAENLLVDIKVELDPDAMVQRAEIVDRARMATDPFYRAAAESALRAVLNPLCRSLKDVALPPEQYEQWKDMTISFNPKEMIGA